MEHGSQNEHQAVEPSGTMVREHWSNWHGFTRLIKFGIVAVLILLAIFSAFFLRCPTC